MTTDNFGSTNAEGLYRLRAINGGPIVSAHPEPSKGAAFCRFKNALLPRVATRHQWHRHSCLCSPIDPAPLLLAFAACNNVPWFTLTTKTRYHISLPKRY